MSEKSVVITHIDIQRDNRNRQSVLFRWILVAPVVVLLMLLTQMVHYGMTTVVITVPVILTLLSRGVYPSWLLTYNHAIMELSLRLISYMLLLTDEYPSIEANKDFEVIFPEIKGGKSLNRWLPFVKWFLAIPLVIVGLVYSAISIVFTLIAWVMTFSTGKYPKWAGKFVYGTIKFWNRVYGYAIILVTDKYPSFKL